MREADTWGRDVVDTLWKGYVPRVSRQDWRCPLFTESRIEWLISGEHERAEMVDTAACDTAPLVISVNGWRKQSPQSPSKYLPRLVLRTLKAPREAQQPYSARLVLQS